MRGVVALLLACCLGCGTPIVGKASSQSLPERIRALQSGAGKEQIGESTFSVADSTDDPNNSGNVARNPSGPNITARAKKVALVVGTSAYKSWGVLKNPDRDAVLVARALHDLNFELIGGGPLLDPDRDHLMKAIRDLWRRAGPETVVIFYYAGHGTQINQRPYLVLKDAPGPKSPHDNTQLIDVRNDLTLPLQEAGAALSLVIIDACRKELPQQGGGANSRGSSDTPNVPAELLETTLTVFSTDADNDAKDDSPFADAFALAIGIPGLEIREVFEHVGDAVWRATNLQQRPTINLPLTKATFYLAGVTGDRAEDNPRKELAARGTLWTQENFHSALQQKDHWAIERFLRGGMKMDWAVGNRTEFYDFLYGGYFDQKVANLIIANKGVNGDNVCPLPPLYDSEKYYFYVNLVRGGAAVQTFVRAVCNSPHVIETFDRALIGLKAVTEKTRQSAVDHPYRRSPAGDAFPGVYKPLELGAYHMVAEYTGWASAREFLDGSFTIEPGKIRLRANVARAVERARVHAIKAEQSGNTVPNQSTPGAIGNVGPWHFAGEWQDKTWNGYGVAKRRGPTGQAIMIANKRVSENGASVEGLWWKGDLVCGAVFDAAGVPIPYGDENGPTIAQAQFCPD